MFGTGQLDRSRRIVTATLWLGICLVGSTRSQEPPSTAAAAPMETVPEMAPLRVDFEKRLSAAFLPQERRYLEALEDLEADFAEARDYEAAEHTRQAREESERRIRAALERIDTDGEAAISADAASLPEETEIATIIDLPISEATLSGGARIDPYTEGIAGFVDVGAAVEWQLEDVAPGGYEVTLRYQPATAGGGTVRISETFYTLDLAIPSKDQPTISGEVAGTLRIRDGNAIIRLEAIEVLNRKVMILSGLKLTPAFQSRP